MKGSVSASLAGALGCSLCCFGPPLLAMTGATSTGLFSFLEPIRPYMSLFSLSMLTFAYYRVFKKRGDESCCDSLEKATVNRNRFQKRFVLALTPVVLALILFPYYNRLLFAADKGEGTNQITTTTEWTIEGMTCPACAKGLEGGMAAVEGIDSCKVDYKSETMLCSVDEKILEASAISGLVERRGFKAVAKQGGLPSSDEGDEACRMGKMCRMDGSCCHRRRDV